MSGRHYEFDSYIEENRARLVRAWRESEGPSGLERPVRRRPRHPDEIDVLTRLAVARMEQALATGELVITGPRRYRLRVF
ncbi:MAG: hypothetical protein VB144_00930 [Clostridia bacterium]|nr:hypothetical protein [Clostridia bacterium]